MTQQSNWLPEGESQAAGMEMEKLSLLGPFLGLSVFAEDNVSSLLFSFSFSFCRGLASIQDSGINTRGVGLGEGVP